MFLFPPRKVSHGPLYMSKVRELAKNSYSIQKLLRWMSLLIGLCEIEEYIKLQKKSSDPNLNAFTSCLQ